MTLFKLLSVLFVLALLQGCSNMEKSMQKDIYTEIEIAKPPQQVWQVLVDFEAYPEWNPYHVKVEGKPQLDETLLVTIHKPSGKILHIDPHIMELQPKQELVWGGGLKPFFWGRHSFILETTGKGTKLIHKEKFEGWVLPFLDLDDVEEGYHRMNQALKNHLEQ